MANSTPRRPCSRPALGSDDLALDHLRERPEPERADGVGEASRALRLVIRLTPPRQQRVSPAGAESGVGAGGGEAVDELDREEVAGALDEDLHPVERPVSELVSQRLADGLVQLPALECERPQILDDVRVRQVAPAGGLTRGDALEDLCEGRDDAFDAVVVEEHEVLVGYACGVGPLCARRRDRTALCSRDRQSRAGSPRARARSSHRGRPARDRRPRRRAAGPAGSSGCGGRPGSALRTCRDSAGNLDAERAWSARPGSRQEDRPGLRRGDRRRRDQHHEQLLHVADRA